MICMLHRILKILNISLITIFVVSCTSNKHPQDPFEEFNRNVYGFNKTIDSGIVKPVSYIYWRYLPQPAQTGIGNFYDNLKDIPNIANDLLQFEFAYVTYDLSRFLINSTIGIFGFFDVAGSLGLEHRKNDFGQTLYHWGYKNSAYLVLPIIGPSSFRDGIGFFVDYCALSVWPWLEPEIRYPLLTLDAIDTRARLLRTETVLNTVALDEYAFIRDAYFQRRQYLFNQGKEASHNTVNPYDHDDIDDISLENEPASSLTKENPTQTSKETPKDGVLNEASKEAPKEVPKESSNAVDPKIPKEVAPKVLPKQNS